MKISRPRLEKRVKKDISTISDTFIFVCSAFFTKFFYFCWFFAICGTIWHYWHYLDAHLTEMRARLQRGRRSTKYCIYRKSAPPRAKRLLRPNKWTSHKYENRHAKNKYAFYLQSLEFTNRMRCLRDVSIISTVRCSIPPPTRRSNPIQPNPIHL